MVYHREPWVCVRDVKITITPNETGFPKREPRFLLVEPDCFIQNLPPRPAKGVSNEGKENIMTTFVPEGNQSPVFPTNAKEGAGEDKKKPVLDPAEKTAPNPFSGWKRPDDEFVTDL